MQKYYWLGSQIRRCLIKSLFFRNIHIIAPSAPRSSNGRTRDFESRYDGSNPSLGALGVILFSNINRVAGQIAGCPANLERKAPGGAVKIERVAENVEILMYFGAHGFRIDLSQLNSAIGYNRPIVTHQAGDRYRQRFEQVNNLLALFFRDAVNFRIGINLEKR